MKCYVTIKTEVRSTKAIEPADVFEMVKKRRDNGDLTASMRTASVQYEASKSHKGMLDQVQPDGKRQPGHFKDGAFVLAK